MGYSWYIYAPVTITAAERAVDAMYEALAAVVGEDLADHLEPGEALEPSELGLWPDLSVPLKPLIPSVAEQRAALDDPSKTGVSIEEAALARLAKCTATVRIDRPAGGFDPALVTALRALVAKIGPCVFTEALGFTLTTSESLITTLATQQDLATALRAIEVRDSVDGDEDEDEDEDEEEDEDEDEDEAEDEPAPDSARPEMLRMLLGEIAQQPRMRRKVSELLGNAPPLVAAFAERLARIGAEPDAACARALNVTEADLASARKALATIFRRAESR